jgi:hypothetical protein
VGTLLAWALIALIAPVLPSADVLPEAVFVVALAAALTYVPGRFWPASEARLEQVAWAAALVGVAGGLMRVPTLVSGYRTTPESAAWIAATQATLAIVTLVLAPPVYRYLSSRTATAVMSIGFLAATVLCGALIVGVPDPRIDLFYVLNDGPRQLLGGHNPYAITYLLPTPQSLGYLPGMLLLSLPVVAISDIRWLLLPMVPLAAVCLRGLAHGAPPDRGQLLLAVPVQQVRLRQLLLRASSYAAGLRRRDVCALADCQGAGR